MRHFRTLCLCMLFAWQYPLHSQDNQPQAGNPPEGKPQQEGKQAEKSKIPKFAVRNSTSGKRMVFVEGKPFTLVGARNVLKAEDLDAVKALGINTVLIEVLWAEKTDYKLLHQFAEAAAEKEIWVVLSIGLVPPPQPDDPTLVVSPLSKPYSQLLADWLKYVVDHFRDLPNLLGYATQDNPGLVINHSDRDFQSYLRRMYSMPANLIQSWKIQVTGFEAATLEVAQKLDDSLPASFARSSVDVCVYQWAALSDLMRIWAKELRALDKERLIFTGRLADYKTIISVPDDYDVVIPAAYPTLLEPDKLAHNVHAIDMARQANQFAVTPSLLSSGGQGVLDAEVRQQLPNWIHEAFLHGSAGVWLSDWEKLHKADSKDAGKPNELDARLTQQFKAISESRIAESLPQATVAFVYEPFGEGIFADGNPLYGFARQLSLEEPNHPFFDFRRGTRYGLVDYLSHDSLTRVDLSQYRTIIAPLCLWLLPEAEAALTRYVQNGGVLLADLGIGMAQAGGTFVDVPPGLQQLFGNWGINRLVDMNRNMTVFVPHELFPSLQPGMMSRGVFAAGLAFTQPIGLIRQLYGDTVPLAWAVRGDRGSLRDGAATLTVRPFGRGYGVYAPFRLWSHWRPENDLYPEFHSDLVKRGATISLNNEPGLFPSTVAVAAMRDGVSACNIASQKQYAQVDTIGIGNLLYSGALTAVSPLQGRSAGVSLGFLETLPPFVASLERKVSQRVTLHLDLQPGELRYCHYLPIQLEPLEQFAMARVTNYKPERIDINVFGASGNVGLNASGSLNITNPASVKARLTVYSGDYKISPNSLHQAVITNTKEKVSETRELTADDQGRLVIEGKFQSHTIAITPKAE